MTSDEGRKTNHVSRFTFHILRFTPILLIFPALIPLLGSQFTCGYDNTFHLWRSVEVEHMLRQGVLYPRWAADMAHGYGFPLFNFVSPLSAYAAAVWHFMGLPWVRAVNFTFALGLLLSGLTVYLFAAEHLGQRAGLVAAVAYVYAPFQAYDVFNRGSLSEAFAWWLPPLALWGLSRWRLRRGGGALLVTSLSFAALILTHNLFAFLFGPLFVGVLLLPRADDARITLKNLARGALPLALGLGLTAFFWLPGLVEREWVQTERLLGVWVFDYRNNFLSWNDLLALPRTTDPALVNDWPPRALGLVPALLALLSLLGWRRYTRPQHWLIALLLVGMVGFGLMTLPVTRALWDHAPLLTYAQFPWRFLGPAALCAAVLAGATVAALSDESLRADLLSAGLIVTLFLAHQGWFFPDHCAPPGDTSVAGMIRWEQATDTLGATAGGEYLPVWVKQMPDHPQLLADYASGGSVRRLDPAALPPGAEILHADYGPTSAEIELLSPQPFQATYLAFYYPGWRVSVDGRPVKVTPSDPHGLITFDAPAGRHTIRVAFGSTPLRSFAALLSALGAAAVFLIVLRLRALRGAQSALSPRPNLPIALFTLAFVLAAYWLIASGHTPLRQTRLEHGQLRGVDHPYAINFDQRWMLLGHDRLPDKVASGGALEVVLYWRALNPAGRDYAASLTLLDADGRPWTQVGMRAPRWHRTPPPVSTWPADGYGLTAYLADLLPGAPPGEYRLALTAFDKADPQTPLTAYAPDGVAIGPALELGTVRVERPTHSPDPADVPMQTRLDAQMGSLTLIGASLDREQAAPGDPMLITLFWQMASRQPSAVGGLTTHLALVDETGSEAAAWDLPPVREDWPTTEWQPGDLWRGQHLLRIPGALESGDYTWQLHVGADAVELGQLRVNAPERVWTAPPLDIVTAAELGDQVILLGANVAPGTTLQPPTILTATLAWQARAEMETSYRVFMHLLRPDGSLLTQSDGEPVNWTRPTTGWAAGEVVLDVRTLDVPADAPPGEYALLAGLYDPDTGARLALPDGTDAVFVTVVTIDE
jgi:hypothetical protein